MHLGPFVRSYLECALWSTCDESTPEGGEPFDKNYTVDDIDKDSVDRAIVECDDFMTKHSELLLDAGDDEANGHDFWLTRNQHGAGFWSRDYDEKIGKALTEAAHSYGERNMYLGDDNKIHFD